jgi:hypothetical protein
LRPPADGWHDLRDGDGKLCARLDTKRMVLEIRRSDRRQVERFDLRKIMDEMKAAKVQSEA